MRQHVNPLSKNFDEIEIIPSLIEMFDDSQSPLHLDIGCASGQFLFDLALSNMCNIHNYDNSYLKSNSLMFNYYVFKKKKF